MTVSDCIFSSNEAGLRGGAIYTDGGNFELVDCTFTNNHCYGRDSFGTGYGGGAIYTRGYTTCTGCTFTNNIASNNGGAVLNFNKGDGDFFTCYGCIFENNNAGQGGAI